MAKLHIGTSGWSYPHWKNCFYTEITRKHWLKHYARQFNSVEVNASFYRLQSAKTFQNWRDQTPDTFQFCLKANRYVTHTKKLNNPRQSIVLEKEHAHHLRPKLAIVLWQLPATLTKNGTRLAGFIDALSNWHEVRHTIEFRHKSWFDNDTSDILALNNIAVCISDAADWPIWLHTTADFVYVRLHGHSRTYSSSYTTQQLKKWAAKIEPWLASNKEVWIYFDNDTACAAVHNAIELQKLLKS